MEVPSLLFVGAPPHGTFGAAVRSGRPPNAFAFSAFGIFSIWLLYIGQGTLKYCMKQEYTVLASLLECGAAPAASLLQ